DDGVPPAPDFDVPAAPDFEAPAAVKPQETAQQKRIRTEAERLGVEVGYVDTKPHGVKDPIQSKSFDAEKKVEDYSFYWWFNYFWAEGRRGGESDATADERSKFWQVVSQMFKPEGLPKNEKDLGQINKDGLGLKLKDGVENYTDSAKKQLLQTLMDIGFE